MSLWRRKPPLTGEPKVRRMKTYSAESGYVYQYFYRGMRREETATEYVFEIASAGRDGTFASVRIEHGLLQTWERMHQRALRPNEEYAFAKMALFEAFDTRSDPADLSRPVRPDLRMFNRIADALNW